MSISLWLSFSFTLSISESGVSEVTETISIGGGVVISIVGVSNSGGVSSTVGGQVLSISLWLGFGLTLSISKSGVSEVTETIAIGSGEAISVVGVRNRSGVSSMVGGQVLGISISLRLSFGLTLTIHSMRIGAVGISVAMRDTISIGGWVSTSISTISTIHSPRLWVSHGSSGQACLDRKIYIKYFKDL